MARSIHDTWGVMERARRDSWSDPEVPRAIVAEMRRNLMRQSAIRQGERRLRRQGPTPPQPVDPAHLPIFVDDQAPHIVHPTTEEDLRAILGRLPPGSLDGLQAVRLCVDHAESSHEHRVRDPFTGRMRREAIPGVYTSSTAGTYSRHEATIRLFACLCDPATLGPFELYFKMSALKTLLHEAAHHFDLTFRTRRSRWDLADRDKKEAWADRAEDEQAAQIILPYIRERYPIDSQALLAWIKEHGGVALPLDALLGERVGATTEDAFLDLVRRVRRGEGRDEARTAFARLLHRAGDNERSVKVAEKVLDKHPDYPGALAVVACVLQCEMGKYESGESMCRRALAADPTCVDAWEVLARGLVARGHWEQAAHASEQGAALAPPRGPSERFFLDTLARSHLCLGRWADVDSDLARMRDCGTRQASQAADVYRALALCWREQWAEALHVASRLLSLGTQGLWGLWLDAVRFECSQRLGHPHPPALDEASISRLESLPFTAAWARRIRDLGAAAS